VPSLRTLIIGGEAVQQGQIDTWASHISVFVGYGLTETFILATMQRVILPGPGNGERSIFDNDISTAIIFHTWIANPENHRQIVPLGAVGELLINGPILAREYLHDPIRTAASFVSVPELGPGRFFKTGDLVKYGPRGSIRYLGRKDNTVKLRGQRINLSEVEFRVKEALLNLSNITILLLTRRGIPSLAVFFCPRTVDGGLTAHGNITLGNPTSDQLADCRSAQTALVHYLPAIMIPTLWIPISYMPLTGSGKLDTALLKQMFNSTTEDLQLQYALAGTNPTREPSLMNPMEQSLRAIWATILGLDPITIHLDDSSFLLGRNSLSVIRLVAMAEEKGLGLSAQQALNNPTLRRMAQVAGDREVTIEMDEVPAFSLIPFPADEIIREACRQCGVVEDEIVDIYPSTHLQDGLMVLSVKQPGTYIANFAFRLPDCLDIVRYRASWAQVITHLLILRSRIIYIADSGFRQVVIKFGMEWSELETNSLESTLTSEQKLMETVIGQPLSKYAVAHTKDQGCVFLSGQHIIASMTDGQFPKSLL
jgi:acyl carrier protein